MKKLVIVLTVLFVFSAFAYAQMGGMTGEQKGEMKGGMMPCGMMGAKPGMMDEGMMPMMQMCMPMMKQMMGQGMMMGDMMQMMMNMMDMQEKMMMGAKPSEKKKMMMNMEQMKEKMQKMMSMRMSMMGPDDQPKPKCAEEWLKKAIDLHEIHIKDPKTATEASQHEMMDQMKKAYECVKGTGSEMGGTQPKEAVKGEKKKDEHGH